MESIKSIIHFVEVFNRAGKNDVFWQKLLIGFGSTFTLAALLIWKRNKNEGDSYHKSRYRIQDDHVSHFGKCHCERVSFKMVASKNIKAVDIPSKIRFPKVSVPFSDFELLCDDHFLSIFSRNTTNSRREMHVFCSYCGVHILHAPTDNPAYLQINADCLDHSTIKSFDVSFHTNGEEKTVNPVATMLSPVNDRKGSGCLSLKDGRVRVGSDTEPLEDGYPYCYYDNESESSSSSKTTLTYDFSPNPILMHHHSQSETPSLHSYKSSGVLTNGSGSYIEAMMMGRTSSPPSQSRDHHPKPSTQIYDEYFRHADSLHLNPDWSHGARFVYNSIYNENVVNRRENNKYRLNMEDVDAHPKPSHVHSPPFSSPISHFDLNEENQASHHHQSFSDKSATTTTWGKSVGSSDYRSRNNYSGSNGIERLRKYLN